MSETKPKIPDEIYLLIGSLLNAKDHNGKNIGIFDSAIVAQVRKKWHDALWVQQATDVDLQDVIDKMRHAKAKEDNSPQERAVLVSGDKIEPERIDWLWDGYLARGKLHLLAGAPQAGKTTIALGFGAAITCGGFFPDKTRAPIGDIAIWTGEDGVEDTLLPRLIAMGADRRRVHFVQGIVGRNGKAAFDPARDMDLLGASLDKHPDVRYLLVDPVVSIVTGDSNQSNNVRRALQPLVDMTKARDLAALGITHLTKGTAGRDPVERVNGSVAFGALARVILFATVQQEQDGVSRPRLLVRAKTNISQPGGGFEYELQLVPVPGYPDLAQQSTVLWGAPVSGNARELLADAEVNDDEVLTPQQRCLLELLHEGPMHSVALYAAAAARGYSEGQMQRARKRINERNPARIIVEKVGMKDGKPSKDGGWDWFLSEHAPQRAKGA